MVTRKKFREWPRASKLSRDYFVLAILNYYLFDSIMAYKYLATRCVVSELRCPCDIVWRKLVDSKGNKVSEVV